MLLLSNKELNILIDVLREGVIEANKAVTRQHRIVKLYEDTENHKVNLEEYYRRVNRYDEIESLYQRLNNERSSKYRGIKENCDSCNQ